METGSAKLKLGHSWLRLVGTSIRAGGGRLAGLRPTGLQRRAFLTMSDLSLPGLILAQASANSSLLEGPLVLSRYCSYNEQVAYKRRFLVDTLQQAVAKQATLWPKKRQARQA